MKGKVCVCLIECLREYAHFLLKGLCKQPAEHTQTKWHIERACKQILQLTWHFIIRMLKFFVPLYQKSCITTLIQLSQGGSGIVQFSGMAVCMH